MAWPRAAQIGWIVWLLLLAGGCSSAHEEPLELTAVGPQELEADGQLYVKGRRLPVGGDGALLLEGVTYRPGQAPKEVRWETTGHAVSRSRLAVTIDREALDALGHRGTFRGHLVLRFAGGASKAALQGELREVVLDLAGMPLPSGPSREQLRRRAEDVLAFIGLDVDDASTTHGGLQVMATVDAQGKPSQGLAPGDRLIEANGVRLHSLSDLAPPPGARTLRLMVARSREHRPVALEWSLAGFELAILDPALQPVAFLLIGCLWFLAFYGPFSSPSLWVARVQSRIRHGENLLSLGIWDRDRRALGQGAPGPHGTSHHRLDALPTLLAASLLFMLAFLDGHYGIRLDALELYLVMAALLVWGCQRTATETLKARIRHARRPLIQLALMLLILGSTWVVTGARSLHSLVEHQGALPLRWGVFTQPALFLLFPVYVVVEGRPAQVDPGPHPWARGLTYAGLVMARLLVCGLGAAIFLGGWASQEFAALGPTRAHLLGALLFTLKAYGLALLLHAADTLSLGRRRSPWSLLGLCGVAAVVTLVFVLVGPSEDLRLFCGTVLSTAAALVTITAGVRVLRSPAPMGATPRHPMPFQ